MIIVDTALRNRALAGRPVRVGISGAGSMGRAVVNQIVNSVPGIEVAAIANRHVDAARRAYAEADAADPVFVGSPAELDAAIRHGRGAVTDNPDVVCAAAGIDAVLEVTGTIEHGAQTALVAFAHRKHVVLMNAELEATLGPILKVRADNAGVVFSGCDGDQPGVELNLFRFVRSIGLTPLVAGNIKGLQDRQRTPATQAGYARTWGLSAEMATSFADGTKISFEQAVVANGTGMRVARRGMLGGEFEGHVDELTRAFDVDELRRWGGIVDYVVGAKPSPGVFVLATHDDPRQRRFLELYKLGPGPLYSFYTPYHLCHFEVPLSLARVVLFGDAVTAPLGAPVVHVVATAKRDIAAGEVLDGIGGYMTYGQCENADATIAERLLPMGLAEGCRARRTIARDQVIAFDDVDMPGPLLAHRLWAEQVERFSPVAVAD